MEPRIRILFISYITILLLIVGVGVVPYFVKGDYKKDTLVVDPARVEKEAEKPEPVAQADAETAAKEADDLFTGTAHVIETDAKTHFVRFELLEDEALFEQASDRLFAMMDGKNGSDIVINYKKKADPNGNIRYNFSESQEVFNR